VHEFFMVIVDCVSIVVVMLIVIAIVVFLASCGPDRLEQFQQAVSDTEHRVVLAQLQKRPRPAPVRGR
jgi:hypothetical protein